MYNLVCTATLRLDSRELQFEIEIWYAINNRDSQCIICANRHSPWGFLNWNMFWNLLMAKIIFMVKYNCTFVLIFVAALNPPAALARWCYPAHSAWWNHPYALHSVTRIIHTASQETGNALHKCSCPKRCFIFVRIVVVVFVVVVAMATTGVSFHMSLFQWQQKRGVIMTSSMRAYKSRHDYCSATVSSSDVKIFELGIEHKCCETWKKNCSRLKEGRIQLRWLSLRDRNEIHSNSSLKGVKEKELILKLNSFPKLMSNTLWIKYNFDCFWIRLWSNIFVTFLSHVAYFGVWASIQNLSLVLYFTKIVGNGNSEDLTLQK